MTTDDEKKSDILPDDKSNDVAYWQSRSMVERLAAIEALRRITYGDAACNGRVLRVLEMVRLPDL